MAYPEVGSPYGMIPINLIGGQVFAGSTRLIPIATNSSTAIYFGDVVKLANTGTLARDAGTDAATPVGVFLGCSYTDATFGKTFRQYYPGTTNVTDVVAYVADDPSLLFKVAVVSTGTTISYATRANVGENAVLVQNSGSTANGDSRNAISSTTATTSTWPLRIVDVVKETALATNSASYTEVIVKWNAGMHQYDNPAGI
tara:strand:+ start:3602 stop:4201 length:600 start_codon:yes stop_codon:yes gene_type:complete